MIERVQRKYDNKFMEKVSSKIRVKMVELSAKTNNVGRIALDNNYLFGKLCYVLAFTKEVRENMDKLMLK